MLRPLVQTNFQSSFLSVDKDTNLILRKLLIESRPYSDMLKRLLLIPERDCITNMSNIVYNKTIQEASVKWLWENGYITNNPKIKLKEYDEKKSILLITFDNFTRNKTNPQFRDCQVSFQILSHNDLWDIGDYQIRPIKIAGYIDGILNNCRLTGIGTFQFQGGQLLKINEQYMGYSIVYNAIHGSDDEIPQEG